MYLLKAGSDQGPLLGQPPASPWREAFGFPPWLAGGVPAQVSFNPDLSQLAARKQFTNNRVATDKNIGWKIVGQIP